MPIDLPDNSVPDQALGDSLEGDLIHKEEQKTGEQNQEDQVPYNEDPKVQLYIERQIAKRVGEGNQAWEERLNRLEQNLSRSRQPETPTTKIGDWTPATSADAQAAKAIIQQAKQEMLEEFRQQQEQITQQSQAEDAAFTEWLGELKVTNTLKDETEAKEFAKLIVRYKLDDRQAAVDLWNELQQRKEEGQQEGVTQGIKKAQQARVGSSRTGREPGQQGRTYQERRAQEPNMNAILEREMTRLGY